jgi:uncharacterized protein YcfL
MKKAILAAAAVMFLISCGGSGETVTNDSTTVVDTTVVVDTLTTNVDSVGAGGQSPHSTPIK